MDKSQLTRIIEETILDMLKERDEGLVALMMEHERNLGGDPGIKDEFINETINIISERLGLLVEDNDTEGAEIIVEDTKKMMELVKGKINR